MKMPIPQDWDGETYCRFSICWPNSTLWRAILRGQVSEPGRGFFWDERTGIVIDVLADFRCTYGHNLDLWEVIMDCNDNGIATALTAIAQAINNTNAQAAITAVVTANACCEQTIINQNGGIVKVFIPPGGSPTPIYGTQPILDVPPGEFPPGYEDEAAYLLDKCQVANLLVNGLIATLRSLALLDLGDAKTVAALIVVAVASVIIFPPTLIPAIGGALIILVGANIILDAVADHISANRDEWICALYKNDGVQVVVGAIAELLDILIAEIEVSGPIGLAIKAIALLIMNGDTLNQLFSLVAHQTFPDANCDDCTPCQGIENDLNFLDDRPHSSIILGTGDLTIDGVERTLSSVLSANGNHYIDFGYYGTDNDPKMPCCNYAIRITGLTNSPKWHNAIDCEDNTFYSFGTLVSVDDGGVMTHSAFYKEDDNSFTVTLKLCLVGDPGCD